MDGLTIVAWVVGLGFGLVLIVGLGPTGVVGCGGGCCCWRGVGVEVKWRLGRDLGVVGVDKYDDGLVVIFALNNLRERRTDATFPNREKAEFIVNKVGTEELRVGKLWVDDRAEENQQEFRSLGLVTELVMV